MIMMLNNSEFLETIRVVDGYIFHLSYHQKRYERVLNYFGIKEVKNLKDFINPPSKGFYKCRLIYSFDAVNVSFHKYQKRDITSFKLIYDDEIDYSFKSVNRDSINTHFASKGECDDILIVKNSLITDTSIANVAFYKNGIWYTPKKPLLCGTTRARLLEEGRLQEADIKVEDLYEYSKMSIFNALIDFDLSGKLKILQSCLHIKPKLCTRNF